jgi:hypothetical protein
MRAGPHLARSGHMSALDPCSSKAWVFSTPESRDPAVGSPDPTQRGLGPDPEVRIALVGALDLALEVRSICTGVRHFPMRVQTHCWYLGVAMRFGLYVQGSGLCSTPLQLPWPC